MRKVVGISIIVVMLLFTLVGCNEKNGNLQYEILTRGKIEGKIYINKSIKTKITLPETWEFATDSEIAELMKIDSNDLKEIENVDDLTTSSLYDVVAKDTETMKNLYLFFEKSEDEKNETEYLEEVKAQIEKDSAEQKIEYKFGEINKQKFKGKDYFVLRTEVSSSGIKVVQNYYIIKEKGFFISIIITAFSDEQVKEIENYIEPM